MHHTRTRGATHGCQLIPEISEIQFPCQVVQLIHLQERTMMNTISPTIHLPLTPTMNLWQQYGCLQTSPRKQYVGQSAPQRCTGSRLITTLCHTSSLSRATCSDCVLASVQVQEAYGIVSYCRTVRKRVCTELTYLNFHECWHMYVHVLCLRVKCVCVCVCELVSDLVLCVCV